MEEAISAIADSLSGDVIEQLESVLAIDDETIEATLSRIREEEKEGRWREAVQLLRTIYPLPMRDQEDAVAEKVRRRCTALGDTIWENMRAARGGVDNLLTGWVSMPHEDPLVLWASYAAWKLSDDTLEARAAVFAEMCQKMDELGPDVPRLSAEDRAVLWTIAFPPPRPRPVSLPDESDSGNDSPAVGFTSSWPSGTLDPLSALRSLGRHADRERVRVTRVQHVIREGPSTAGLSSLDWLPVLPSSSLVPAFSRASAMLTDLPGHGAEGAGPEQQLRLGDVWPALCRGSSELPCPMPELRMPVSAMARAAVVLEVLEAVGHVGCPLGTPEPEPEPTWAGMEEPWVTLVQRCQACLQAWDAGHAYSSVKAAIDTLAGRLGLEYAGKLIETGIREWWVPPAPVRARWRSWEGNPVAASPLEAALSDLRASLTQERVAAEEAVAEALVHFCDVYILSDLGRQAWSYHKPFFQSKRLSYGIQAWHIHLQMLWADLQRVLAGGNSDCADQHRLFEPMAKALDGSLRRIAVFFAGLRPSRARTPQFRADVHASLVIAVSWLHRFGGRDGDGCWTPYHGIRASLRRLAWISMLVAGPAGLLLPWLRGDTDPAQATTEEAEDAIARAVTDTWSVQAMVPATIVTRAQHLPGTACAADVDVVRIRDASEHWWNAVLATPSPLSDAHVQRLVGRRHEVGEWEWPPLTEDDEANRGALREILH